MPRSRRGEMYDIAEQLVRRHRLIRPKDLAAAGVSRAWIDFLRDDGVLTLQPPGVFASPVALCPPELCVAVKWPNAVLAGPSALTVRGRWRELEVPWIAIDDRAHHPHNPMPLVVLRSRGLASDADVEHVHFGGVQVRAFSVDRALADLLRCLERVPSIADLTHALQTALSDGAASRTGIERCARAKGRWPEVRTAVELLLAAPRPKPTEWQRLRQTIPLKLTPYDWLRAPGEKPRRWQHGDVVTVSRPAFEPGRG